MCSVAPCPLSYYVGLTTLHLDRGWGMNALSPPSCTPPDGRVITGSWDGFLKVWNSVIGEKEGISTEWENAVSNLVITRDDTKIISGDGVTEAGPSKCGAPPGSHQPILVKERTGPAMLSEVV